MAFRYNVFTGTFDIDTKNTGDVVGPASSTDNAVARFDGTTGKLLQNSVAILSDAGAFTGLTGITMNGNLILSANGNTITIGGSVLDGGAVSGTIFDINANNGLPVAFFRGTAAGQPLHLYGVSSAANANYERLNWGLVSSVWTFASEAAGTGTVRNFNFTGGKVGIGTTAPSTLLHVGLAGTTLGTIGLAGSTSGLVTIQPAAAAGTWTMTLPVNDGDSGQVLTTDGAGVTSWATSATGDITAVGNVASGAAFDGTAGTTLTFLKENAGSIKLANSTTADTVGATLTISGANGFGDANGGDLSLTSGAGGATAGRGGTLGMTAGSATTDGDGGDININAGSAAGSADEGGSFQMNGGAGAGSGAGGFFALNGGGGGATGAGGYIAFSAGAGGATSGAGGDMYVTAGSATSGNGGSIFLQPGTTSGGGTNGVVQIGADGIDGKLKLYSEQGGTDYFTMFQPGTQTQDITYTLPNDDGSASQVLQTNGSGVLSWATSSAGTSIGLAWTISQAYTQF